MFNTIVPFKLVTIVPSMHRTLGLNTSLYNWILDLLTDRPQVVRVGNITSVTLTLNTGAPPGCVLSPLLYTLFTHECVATHDSNTIINVADDTTVVGLITGDNESAYREESDLAVWSWSHNLSFNVSKTKELIGQQETGWQWSR